MANTSKEVKQRYQEAAYIEVGETYELAGTGFEKLDEEPGAQTSSKKYINDKSSTSSITSYEGTHPFTADQILSEKVIGVCIYWKVKKDGRRCGTFFSAC